MKKLLLGALGMAMATTAMAAESSTGVVSIPVTGLLTIGTPQTPQTGIKISEDSLDFTANLRVDTGNNLARKKITVFKITNTGEEQLAKDGYSYKVTPKGKQWNDVKAFAKTNGVIDENDKVFKLEGKDDFVQLGEGKNLSLALKAQSVDPDGILDVWVQGYINEKYNNQKANIDGQLFVALPDQVTR